MSSSQTSSEKWPETIHSIGKRRGRLELWTGVIGNRAVQDYAAEQKRNRESQGRKVRQQLWDGDAPDESEEMGGHTILGDVTNPAPIVIGNQGGGDIAKTLATLALGGVLGGGGLGLGAVAMHMLTKTPDVITPDVITPPGSNSERVEIGLGRIEDYLSE